MKNLKYILQTKFIVVFLAVAAGLSFTAVAKSATQVPDTKQFNTHVRPQDDFFDYVNGKWAKSAKIPSSKSSWGSFYILDKENDSTNKKALEELTSRSANELADWQKLLANFYTSGTKHNQNINASKQAIAGILAQIDALTTTKDLPPLLAELHIHGINAFWELDVEEHLKQASHYALYISQAGIGMPDRDYYLKDDEHSKQLRTAYQTYLKNMLLEFDTPSANVDELAHTIMTLETQMAKASKTKVEMRDPLQMYHPHTLTELSSRFSNFNWKTYFKSLNANPGRAIVTSPLFVKEVNTMLATMGVDDLKTYLRWCTFNSLSPVYSKATRAHNFEFYGKAVRGAKSMTEQWEFTLQLANDMMRDALGQLYVSKKFSADDKEQINLLVDDLLAAYKERLLSLDWMSGTTKQKALKKLSTFTRKLGYPDKWYDYPGLTLEPTQFAGNVLALSRHNIERGLKRIGKPIERTEWGMSAAEVNAYYNPSQNEIVFPAGIMQPPFFSGEGDAAMNYGGIGAVIGHEISHGFDDSGSEFDENGNMKNWWTEHDRNSFKNKAKSVVSAYAGFEPVAGHHINGELTLGENIADLGGVSVAYDALQQAIADGRISSAPVNGLTPEQRFFVGYARVWQTIYRDSHIKNMLVTNPHSPAKYRVIGVLSNLPEFYQAFDVRPGDKMYRDEAERAKVW